MSVDIKINTKGLDKLLKSFKGDIPQARVGVLGDKNARKVGGAIGNAVVGAAHEFGTSTLPQRSFLRMPITDRMQPELEEAGAFDPAVVKELLNTGNLTSWVRKLGVLGEKIVADAFASGGFGKWKRSNMKYKKNHQTLVETNQLRESITSDVKT